MLIAFLWGVIAAYLASRLHHETYNSNTEYPLQMHHMQNVLTSSIEQSFS
jgi:hypothetical protein